MKDLEDIIDSCIIETINNENGYDKLKKEFEEYDKMNTQIDNNGLYAELLNVKSEVISNRTLSIDSEGKILEIATQNGEKIEKVDKKFNPILYALIAIFFMLGVIIGIQDEAWRPYVSDIINGARAFTVWTKG